MRKKIFPFVMCAILMLISCSSLININVAAENGLVAEWNFDEGTGGSIQDSSGNGNDGTINGATWTKGISGNALSFDGENDYVDMGYTPTSDISKLTIEFWMNYRSNVGAQGSASGSTNYIISKQTNTGYNRNLWIGLIDSKVGFLFSDGSSKMFYIESESSLQRNNWYYIAVTRDGTTAKIFVNGELEATDSYNFIPTNNNNPFYVGYGYIDPFDNRYFDGIIDEIRLYSRVLSQTEVQSHFTGQPLSSDEPTNSSSGDGLIDTSISSSSQIVNFGKEGAVGADFSYNYNSGIDIDVNADFSFAAGIDFPVKIDYDYPTSIASGDTFEFLIAATGEPGSIWFEYDGSANIDVSVAGLGTEPLYSKSIYGAGSLNFVVPIGANQSQVATSSEITVYTWEKHYESFGTTIGYIELNLRFKMALDILTTSYVEGDISCSGSAVESPLSEHQYWNDSYQNQVDIKSSASPGDDLSLSVSNLNYQMIKLIVKVKTFDVYVGYEYDTLLTDPKNNQYAIDETIDIEDFLPEQGTRADLRDLGELMNDVTTTPIPPMSVSLEIPEPPESPDTSGDSSSIGEDGFNYLLLLIPVAIIGAVVVYFVMRSKRLPPQGKLNSDLSPSKEPPPLEENK